MTRRIQADSAGSPLLAIELLTAPLVIAEALLKDTMLRYAADDYQVVAYGKGSDLEGISLGHPFYDREVPIILGEHVTTEAGTGAVLAGALAGITACAASGASPVCLASGPNPACCASQPRPGMSAM